MEKLQTQLIFIIVILVLLLTGAGGYIYKLKNEKQEITNLYGASLDELRQVKNKNGQYVATIEAMKSAEVETFLQMETKDAFIAELQDEVKRNKRVIKQQGDAIALLASQTRIDTVIVEKEIQPEKLVATKDSLAYTIKNEWITATYGFKLKYMNQFERMDVENTFLNLTVDNKYSVILGSEPTGFLGLGKRKAFAEVTNHNPYTKTTNLRTYQVDGYPEKKFGVGIIGGYGLNLSPPGVQTGLFIGVGVSYNLFRF